MKSSLPADEQEFVARALDDAENEPGSALLGALVDHLLQYAQPDTAAELDVLREASSLFQRGLTLYDQLSGIRDTLEDCLTNPAKTGAPARYDKATADLTKLSADVPDLQDKLTAFQASYSGRWLVPVGQQLDAPVSQWYWRDVFLARCTTLFLVTAKKMAQQQPSARQLAFALGTLGGAAGNLLGGAYLNEVVGGPRRSHRLRHRLAAYTVGAWLRANEPGLAGTLDSIRTTLAFGQDEPSTLPADLKDILTAALQETYPHGTAPLPDLDLGYRNLLLHLSLLDGFTVPAIPQAVNVVLTKRASGFGNDTFGEAVEDDSGPSWIATEWNDAKKECGRIVDWFEHAADTIGHLFSSPDPEPTGTSQQALQAKSQSAEITDQFSTLYGLQFSAWWALGVARSALVLQGLLYPGPENLRNDPTFTQFLSVPDHAGTYPRLPMPESDNGTLPPTSPLEAPPKTASQYDVAASPLVFLKTHRYSVEQSSAALWEALIEHPDAEADQELWYRGDNYNLDGDRGFQLTCWTTAPTTSITKQPLQVVKLNFTEI